MTEWGNEDGWLPTCWVLPSVPPDPEPYHRAGEVVLRQAEIHHTLRAVELPRGQLWQGLWHGVEGDRNREVSLPFPQEGRGQLGAERALGDLGSP